LSLKVLNIVESAYRATLEEQDDTVIWITHAMRGAGAELGVVLCGNAVNYAVKGQDARGLSFGGRTQTQPPDIARDLGGLRGKGVPIYAVQEDLAALGIERSELIEGIESIPRVKMVSLLSDYDQIWHW
jgi:sulfur transfer complex TusBCD TusB component (DsrH family)